MVLPLFSAGLLLCSRRFIENELQVQPSGVVVQSRYRPEGHVSEGRAVRQQERTAMRGQAASSQAEPWRRMAHPPRYEWF